MTKRGGTWARLDESVHMHPKTLELAEALEALDVPPEWSVDVVVAQLHRLVCWCARESDTGRVGHLTAKPFALIVGWSNPASAPALLDAWHRSGFIDYGGTPRATVHEFEAYANGLLRHRERAKRAQNARTPRASRASPRKQETGNRKPEDDVVVDVRPPVDVARIGEDLDPPLRGFCEGWADAFGVLLTPAQIPPDARRSLILTANAKTLDAAQVRGLVVRWMQQRKSDAAPMPAYFVRDLPTLLAVVPERVKPKRAAGASDVTARDPSECYRCTEFPPQGGRCICPQPEPFPN